MSDLLNKIKNFFIKPKVSSNDVDNLQFNILSNGIVESPPVSFQLIFKVYKDKLDSSIVKAKSLRLNINSMYLDDYYLGVSREKEFVPVDNPCGADLPQITGYYFWDKKYVSTGVYFNAALLNDVDFQSANPVIEVYDFTEGGFSILPFEYCSTEVPNPTKYDFLVDIKSATTLLNPIESEEDVDYYIYTADLEGKIYLAPLIEITWDSYTLQQLNEILGKDASNTMFSHKGLASINSLEYNDIANLSLNLDNFKYFTNLSKLTINNCDLDNIPDDIANLSNLQEIVLNNNHISNLSIFKNRNLSVTALGQQINLPPISGYTLSLDFLRDANNNIPEINFIAWNGKRIGDSIVWGWDSPPPTVGTTLYFSFSSNSSLCKFSGIVISEFG